VRKLSLRRGFRKVESAHEAATPNDKPPKPIDISDTESNNSVVEKILEDAKSEASKKAINEYFVITVVEWPKDIFPHEIVRAVILQAEEYGLDMHRYFNNEFTFYRTE
jgi:hypothetical protein